MKIRINQLLAAARPIVAAIALLLTGGMALAQSGSPSEQAASRRISEAAEPKAGVVANVEQGIVPAIVAIVVFAVVFGVLATKVWPTISKGLEDRASKIRDEIASAEAARKQAKEALAQYEKSLGEARAEAQKMLEQARAQQLALANELKGKAEAELSALKERARKDIEAAKRAAITEIFNRAVDEATGIASKILQREVNAADHRRITLEAVSELETTQS